MNVMMVFLALVVFLIGILYLRLHALPEHMAHGTQKVQYEIVAVLALISLFTHNHLYWIIGLLLALVQISGLLDATCANGRFAGQDGRGQENDSDGGAAHSGLAAPGPVSAGCPQGQGPQ